MIRCFNPPLPAEQGQAEAQEQSPLPQTPEMPQVQGEGAVSAMVHEFEREAVKEVEEIKEEIAEAKKLGFRGLVVVYFKKFAGRKEKRPPRMATIEALYSWITGFIGIGLIAALHYHWLTHEHLVLVVGSFGASAVLIFGSVKSPLAQPRNFVGGHLISAIVGVTVRWWVYKQSIAIASGFAVATAIAFMQLTNCVHPPGGATALIAVTSARMPWGGYQYVFMPILSGCACMLLVALVVNNLWPTRVYPSFWW
eukprot:Phypoly_transcript_13910.p1 GENE.Phypoly_transcript_13910~~Phypoly_transcript_13910.p1  ORF type:complete len:253 (+),score=32.35 Phypoly_transcript_13910:165-923(+)